MEDEILKVLNLLEEGKINKDEALKLITALKGEVREEVKGKKHMRIFVEKEGKRLVNIRLPLSFISFVLNRATVSGKKTISIEGEEIPIDVEEIIKAVNDPDFQGKIIDVDEPEKAIHVEIEIL